jgi:CHASE2 domain-containing sensor protein
VRRRWASSPPGSSPHCSRSACPRPACSNRVEGQAQDAQFQLRGAQPAPDVAVIAIDAEDITALGQWPIRRIWHARAIDALRKARVRGVAYDVQFTEPSGASADDYALFEAVARAPGTVLSTTEVDEKGRHERPRRRRNLKAARRARRTRHARSTTGAVVRRRSTTSTGSRRSRSPPPSRRPKRQVPRFDERAHRLPRRPRARSRPTASSTSSRAGRPREAPRAASSSSARPRRRCRTSTRCPPSPTA